MESYETFQPKLPGNSGVSGSWNCTDKTIRRISKCFTHIIIMKSAWPCWLRHQLFNDWKMQVRILLTSNCYLFILIFLLVIMEILLHFTNCYSSSRTKHSIIWLFYWSLSLFALKWYLCMFKVFQEILQLVWWGYSIIGMTSHWPWGAKVRGTKSWIRT